MKEEVYKKISVIFILLSCILLIVLGYNAWEKINFFRQLNEVREDADILAALSEESRGEIAGSNGKDEAFDAPETEESTREEETADNRPEDILNNQDPDGLIQADTSGKEKKDGTRTENSPAVSSVTLQEIADNRDRYEIIDVREPEEFSQGRIKGARNVRLGDILNIKEVQDRIKAEALKKELVFFCHDGTERSTIAADFFAKKIGIPSSIIKFAFKDIRKDMELAERVWTGSLKRVLPIDFWRELKHRRYKLRRIVSNLVIDLTLEKVYPNIDLSGKTVIHAPVMVMAGDEVDKIVSDIGQQTAAFICNTRASCFYSKIISYRIRNNGGDYEGFYYYNSGKEDKNRS